MIWMAFSCTQVFDISSSVLITSTDGTVVDATDAEFCHRLNTTYSTEEEPEYFVSECITTDVQNGFADLPNWEGVYRGEVTTIELWWTRNDAIYDAVLIDTDEDVWCDNVDVDTDINGNMTTTPFCTSNFEFYLLWSMEIPSGDE